MEVKSNEWLSLARTSPTEIDSHDRESFHCSARDSFILPARKRAILHIEVT